MTADAAARAIREEDPDSSIGLVSKETSPPYARPPLSKALWKGEEELDDIDLNTEEVELEMHLGLAITKIDRSSKKIIDEKKNEYSYNKLLISTGGTPRKLPNVDTQGIIYYRTLEDYKKLKALLDKNVINIGICGGSFIGSEIAAAIKIYKPEANVTMIFPENGICEAIFPKGLSNFLNAYYKENGINVITNELVTNVDLEDQNYLIKTSKGQNLKFQALIAGLGIKPNIELAQDAGLKINEGIQVNELLQTSDPDIFAAGDVATCYNSPLSKYIRVEHEDNALTMGDIAGRNMTGQQESFNYLSLFYSDLFDYGYEAVGELDSKLDLVEDWADPNEQGIVYYLKNSKVRGVLLWNVWEKAEEAREIIASQKTKSAKDLKGLITIE